LLTKTLYSSTAVPRKPTRIINPNGSRSKTGETEDNVNATTTIIKFEKFHKATPCWGNQGSGWVNAAAAGRFRRKVGYFWSLAKFMSSKVQFGIGT
jgi:hypothetical protein